MPNTYLAQVTQPRGSTLDNISRSLGINIANLGQLVSTIALYAFPLAGILLLLYLLYGGFKLLLSHGDPKAMDQGKQIITNALIGFVVVFVSFWLVQAVGTALGINIISQMFS